MTQKRVVLFAHDAKGLGHVRRVARIAEALQGPCACLVVCGLREAAWIVPRSCELLKPPGWDGMRASRAAYWGRKPWLKIEYAEAVRLRQQWLLDGIRTFAPDAIIVDYLPFGRDDEMRPALEAIDARKYYVLRGIVDRSDTFLRGDAAESIGRAYDRVLVAADRRIIDVVEDCRFDAATASKVTYAGYVAPAPVDHDAVRAARGIPAERPWVVCSGGGGMHAEEVLLECTRVARTMPDVQFDIVFGPRTNHRDAAGTTPNCRVTHEHRDLPELHAASDVAVIAGGYNSLIEAASGGARVIVKPSAHGDDDEQERSATLFAEHYPVTLIADAFELGDAIASQLEQSGSRERPVLPLDTRGAATIRDIVLRDLEQLRGIRTGARS